VASLYVGGGAGAYSFGLEFCRGGNRGGRLGFGFAAAREGGGGGGEAADGLKAGGFGRCAVLRPVVSGLYGPGGGLLASASALLCASSLSCKRCFADPSAGGAAAGLDAVGSAL
jgi:hypothetical protein